VGVRQHESVAISTANVSCREMGLDLDIEYRLHGAEVDRIDQTLTPFLPLASLTAWILRRPTVARSSTDCQALIGASRAAQLLSSSSPEIKGRKCTAEVAQIAPRGTGIWFSRGVDSLGALYENFDEIDFLLGLEFIDAPYAGERQRAIWAETVAAASGTGKPLLHLSTNARDLVDTLAGWDYTHSAVFSGLGLFLSPVLQRAWLAGGHRESTSTFQPSNRSDEQNAWSSSLVAVGQPPGETRRTE